MLFQHGCADEVAPGLFTLTVTADETEMTLQQMTVVRGQLCVRGHRNCVIACGRRMKPVLCMGGGCGGRCGSLVTSCSWVRSHVFVVPGSFAPLRIGVILMQFVFPLFLSRTTTWPIFYLPHLVCTAYAASVAWLPGISGRWRFASTSRFDHCQGFPEHWTTISVLFWSEFTRKLLEINT